MKPEFFEVRISEEPLARPASAFAGSSGAVVEFYGVVRATEGTEAIAGLHYEVNLKMAQHQLEKIAEAALARFCLNGILLHHRFGFVPVGEASLFIRLSAEHRMEAIQGCEWIIDALKQSAPIWKKAVM